MEMNGGEQRAWQHALTLPYTEWDIEGSEQDSDICSMGVYNEYQKFKKWHHMFSDWNIPGEMKRYNGPWCPSALCHQVTSSHDIDYVW